jgi:hypothetical protein
MAARIDRVHSERVRQRIQTSVIVERLHQHMMGELEMTSTQLRAAELLLDRSVPKLAQVQHVGDEEGGPIALSLAVAYAEPDPAPPEG